MVFSQASPRVTVTGLLEAPYISHRRRLLTTPSKRPEIWMGQGLQCDHGVARLHPSSDIGSLALTHDIAPVVDFAALAFGNNLLAAAHADDQLQDPEALVHRLEWTTLRWR